VDDQDVTFTKILLRKPKNQFGIKQLISLKVEQLVKTILLISYIIWSREGTGTAPSNVDGVLASHRGDF
jgi:hypothetical protein